MLLDAAGAVAYTAEISALQTYQNKMLAIMDGMVAQGAVYGITVGVSDAGGAGLGNFPEAKALGDKYNAVMQAMMTNFQEISDLINAMTTALGSSAKNYADAEQTITDQFNKIMQQYQGQNGSFNPTATAAASSSAATTGPANSTTITNSQTSTNTAGTTSTSTDTSSSSAL